MTTKTENKPCPLCPSPARISSKGNYATCSDDKCPIANAWMKLDRWNAPRPGEEKLAKAIRSLKVAGFVDNGGELWKPPLGNKYAELQAAHREGWEAGRNAAAELVEQKKIVWIQGSRGYPLTDLLERDIRALKYPGDNPNDAYCGGQCHHDCAEVDGKNWCERHKEG